LHSDLGLPGLPLKTGWNLHNPQTLTFCMPAKPASHGQHQGLPPDQAVVRLPLITAVVISKCEYRETLLAHFLTWPTVHRILWNFLLQAESLKLVSSFIPLSL
jgi:hypothetical protein